MYLIFLIFSSCAKVDKEIYGNWSVFTIKHNGNEILGVKEVGKLLVTHSMSIDEKNNIIVLPVPNENELICTIQTYVEEGEDILELTACKDSRFNGKYHFKIHAHAKEKESPVTKFTLELNSPTIYIHAEKGVSTIFKE